MPNAKNTAAPGAPIQEAEPTFTRGQLAASKRYAAVRDLMGVLLEDGRQYTLAEADEKIEAFRKGKVN